MTKEKKIFPKGFKNSGLAKGLKGILPTALDAVGILTHTTGLTNKIKGFVQKDAKKLPSIVEITKKDGITEDGKSNAVTIGLVISGLALIINAVVNHYFGYKIDTELIESVLGTFKNYFFG